MSSGTTFLQRVTGWISPSSPGKGVAKIAVRNQVAAPAYESASFLQRAIGWLTSTMGPNASTLPSLQIIRDRARQAARNDGVVGGILEKLVTNAVGTGIKPLSLAEDRAFRKELLALWTEWTDYSDADGVLDWYGQEAQAARCWYEAGEVFLRLRDRLPGDGLPVPLQVQVLEPELCPHTYNGVNPETGNRIRAGIEFDAIGRRVNYYFYRVRPGDFQDWDASQLVPVPAESVLHLFKPIRAGQIRGVPKLTQALVKLRELDQFDDATLVRQKLAAMFVGFVTSGVGDDGTYNPMSGKQPETTTSDGTPVVALEPGLMQELSPGQKVEFSKPPDVITGYDQYMEGHLRRACMAAGIPYEVAVGDLGKVNDRSVRVLLAEFRRSIMCDQHQHLAFQVCRRVWARWMDAVFLSGALKIPSSYLKDARPWSKVEWRPHGWPYLHPVQDVESDVAAIRGGLTSRQAVVSENGDDVEVIDQQQADDAARADALKLKYDSDGRQPKSGGGGTSASAPAAGDEGGGPTPNSKATAAEGKKAA